jgi:hypothetical protein
MRFGAPPPRPRTRLRDLLIAAVLLVSLQAADSFVGPGIPGGAFRRPGCNTGTGAFVYGYSHRVALPVCDIRRDRGAWTKWTGVAAMKMSEDGADGPMSRAERMQKAWRLADEARKALELAKASTARAEELRRSRGAEVVPEALCALPQRGVR